MIGDILQPTHLVFVLVIALLVLGPKRLPEVGRSLGRGLRDFRSALNGEERDRERESVLPQGMGVPSGASADHVTAEPAVMTSEPVETPEHIS